MIKVIRVTNKEFELENGEIYKHPFVIDFVNIYQFQIVLDHCPNFQLICEYVKNTKTKENANEKM